MNKKEMTERCRMILQKTDIKETVSSEDADWLLKNIFPNHPEWGWYEDKGKITHITADKAEHGTTCFYVHFGEEMQHSISYIKCIKNIKNTRQ
jgi:hypothetical protein